MEFVLAKINCILCLPFFGGVCVYIYDLIMSEPHLVSSDV